MIKNYSLSMVVPAFNEEDLLENFVRKSMSDIAKVSNDFEIVLINDGSTDKTREIAQRLAAEFKNLKLINLDKNSGIGIATKVGLLAASKEIIFNNTVDAFWDTKDLPFLIKYLADSDFISGYRTNMKSNSIYGKILTTANYHLIKFLFGLNFKSFQTVQFFRRSFLQSITIEAKSTFLAPELLIKAHKSGKRIKEVSLQYHPRLAGKGKCGTPKNIIWTSRDILKSWFLWKVLERN